MKLRNLKIGTRLAIAFLALLVLLVAVAATGVARMKEVTGRPAGIVGADQLEGELA